MQKNLCDTLLFWVNLDINFMCILRILWHWIDFNDNSLIIMYALDKIDVTYTGDKVQLDTYRQRRRRRCRQTEQGHLCSRVIETLHCFKYVHQTIFCSTIIFACIIMIESTWDMHMHMIMQVLKLNITINSY